VCDGFEHEGSHLSAVGSGADGGTEAAFDHAEDCFDLPALAVGWLV